jgi:hypothetical protein
MSDLASVCAYICDVCVCVCVRMYVMYVCMCVHALHRLRCPLICADYCIHEFEYIPYAGIESFEGVEYDVYRWDGYYSSGDYHNQTFYTKMAADGTCIPFVEINNYTGPCTYAHAPLPRRIH